MSTNTSDTSNQNHPAATPEQLGIGMRLSVHPLCEDFADVILGALHDAQVDGLEEGLVVETDEVSTYVGARTIPAETRLLSYAAGTIIAARRRSGGGHVVAHILLSRGCPGEVCCNLGAVTLPRAYPIRIARTGLEAVAQWSLYPLIDSDSCHGSHMAHIESAVTDARATGNAAEPAHYATKLTGDLADVLATAGEAWLRIGTDIPHVVSHLTVSVAALTQETSGGGRPPAKS